MRICLLAGVLGLLLAAPPLSAQQTVDQARLMLTIGGGFVGGGSLWHIPNQPIADGFLGVDTFDLTRRIRPILGVVFSGTYFPGEHVGFHGEAFLLGLGTEDDCRLATAGTPRTVSVCGSIDGSKKSATAVSISGGVVYRIMSRRLISPYDRLSLGLAYTPQSTISAKGITETGSELVVYSDPDPKRLTGYASLAGGFTAAVARGYQIRLEVRDNYVGVRRVTSATSGADFTPPTSLDGKHIFSLTMGFDVVLERRRGRRY